MSYSYGPPPPPPAAAASNSGGYAAYTQPYQSQRGGHAGRGRGGHPQGDRAGYHASPPAYGYNAQAAQQQPYGQANPYSPAGGYQQQQPHHSQPHQQQHQPHQQWHADQGQQQHNSQSSGQAPILAQNYHPNYAPQIYQQQQHQAPQHQQYSAHQPYPTSHHSPQYNQGYQQPPGPGGPPAQQHWGTPPPPQDQQFGRGRGGYSDRGGPRAQMMGPPIRIGFEGGSPQGHHAPVSNPYPPQPYSGPQGPQGPPSYTPGYGGYPPPAPYTPGPPQHDNRSGHNNQNHRHRGSFKNNHRGRPQFGADKSRHHHNRGSHPQTPSSHHQKPDATSAGKKKKRKTNVLGLTPGEESEEDDENEEERLVEMIGSYVSNPSTADEVATWIADRRANFPTKARVDAKRAAGAQHNSAKKDEDAALERQAEKLRKQLEKVEATMKRKREAQDEGDEMRDVEVSSVDIRSEDGAPETASSRPPPSILPPPPKKADPTKHCKYYSTGGTCGKKGKCRFVHDPAAREAALKERELNGGRMTLSQRLILNDKEQEDLAIVQSLKYLQDRGILQHGVGSGTPSNSAPVTTTSQPSHLPPPPNLGLPPIPPPSVVSNGSAPKYTGWNLSGFGNTGVKSVD